jgi:alkylation response protein AidB-like acyl-CoA dehydrogenase
VRAGERLTLQRDGNGWRLFGRASRVPWGRQAGRVVLLATDPDGNSMVVFGDGVQGARLPDGGSNMAGEPRDTYEFAGLGLSGNEVAPAGSGVDQAALYRRGALARAVMMAGAMERALDTAVNYAQERKQFGRPIASFQAIAHKLAEMKVRLEACRTAVYRAAWLKQEGQPHQMEASIAKYMVGEMSVQNALDAIQIHGGYGYLRDFPVERALRDAKLGSLGGGTSEIQKLIISRLLLGDG